MLPRPVSMRQGVGQPAVPGEPPFWSAPGGSRVAVTGTSTAESDGADVPAPATLQSVTNVRVVYGLLLTRYSTSELPKVCAGRTEWTFDPGDGGVLEIPEVGPGRDTRPRIQRILFQDADLCVLERRVRVAKLVRGDVNRGVVESERREVREVCGRRRSVDVARERPRVPGRRRIARARDGEQDPRLRRDVGRGIDQDPAPAEVVVRHLGVVGQQGNRVHGDQLGPEPADGRRLEDQGPGLREDAPLAVHRDHDMVRAGRDDRIGRAHAGVGKRGETGHHRGRLRRDDPRDRPGSSTSFAPIGAEEAVRFSRSGREAISGSASELDSPADAAASLRARAATSDGVVLLKVTEMPEAGPELGPSDAPVAGSARWNQGQPATRRSWPSARGKSFDWSVRATGRSLISDPSKSWPWGGIYVTYRLLFEILKLLYGS